MARPTLGDSPTERLHIKITAAEVVTIDDWRFANRAESRSEAVRKLCQRGLAMDEALATLRAVLPLLEHELKQRRMSGLPEYIGPVEAAVIRTKKAIAMAEGWT